MNHALLVLLRLQAKALWRRMTRGLRSVKGAMLFIFGVVVFTVWLLPSILAARSGPRSDPEAVRNLAPFVLLGTSLMTLLTSGGEKAIPFTPAEVDLLFAAPFTRRQLLAYKIVKGLAGTFFSSLILSAVLLRFAAGWPQALAALLLAMSFLQFLNIAITLIGQSAGARAFTLGRKLLLALVLVAIAIAIVSALRKSDRPSVQGLAAALRSSRLGSILLAPLEVFGRLFTAPHWPQAFIYVVIALVINAVMLLLVFFLDADYLEVSAARSQILYDRIRRARQGGIMAVRRGAKARWSLPAPPFLRGAGPIIWRQMTVALRGSRALLSLLVIVGLTMGPMFFRGNADPATGVISVMAMLTFILGGTLRFDFRGDLDQMDHLKSLPISPLAIAAGQIITPTLVMTFCNLLIVSGVMIASRRAEPLLLAAAILALPLNALLFGIENWIFLHYPTRMTTAPGDFQGYGRQILVFFAKTVLLLTSGAIAGFFATIAWFATKSQMLTIIAAALALGSLAIATVPLVARAFAKFDVAIDMPA